MRCECGSKSSVLQTREYFGEVRRRRQCDKCKKRWSTLEKRYAFLGHMDNIKKMNRMRRVKAQERQRAQESRRAQIESAISKAKEDAR